MAVFICVPFLLSPVQLCFRRYLYPEGPGYMTTSPAPIPLSSLCPSSIFAVD